MTAPITCDFYYLLANEPDLMLPASSNYPQSVKMSVYILGQVGLPYNAASSLPWMHTCSTWGCQADLKDIGRPILGGASTSIGQRPCLQRASSTSQVLEGNTCPEMSISPVTACPVSGRSFTNKQAPLLTC